MVDLNADMNIVGFFCNANFNNFDITEINANIQPEAKSDSNKQSEVITSSPKNSCDSPSKSEEKNNESLCGGGQNRFSALWMKALGY